jgi:choline dehydrogenase-like flavoprotein
VTGVTYLNRNGEERELRAHLVILAAHALETPRILLLSTNNTFPNGLANSSGKVGCSFMNHPTWQVFGTFSDPINAYKGMQMGHVMVQDYYVPDARQPYARGFVLISYMMTPTTYANLSGGAYGAELKQLLDEYPYTAAWWAHAEGLPNDRNRVTLDPGVKDKWGIPAARIDVRWRDNERAMDKDMMTSVAEMLEAAGCTDVRTHGSNNPPGHCIHEMGGARMSRTPRDGVLNRWNQAWDAKNVFVTDGACMASTACQNPSITYMAITARAAAHAVGEMKRGAL